VYSKEKVLAIVFVPNKLLPSFLSSDDYSVFGIAKGFTACPSTENRLCPKFNFNVGACIFLRFKLKGGGLKVFYVNYGILNWNKGFESSGFYSNVTFSFLNF